MPNKKLHILSIGTSEGWIRKNVSTLHKFKGAISKVRRPLLFIYAPLSTDSSTLTRGNAPFTCDSSTLTKKTLTH